MGKTRDLFEKIRDTKGRFDAKMGSIKEEKRKAKEKRKDYPFECRVPKNSKER